MRPEDLQEILIRIPVLLLALTVHEVSHGYFAYRMGDPTAARMGRLSLNPLRHLDPLGTVCLLFAPIGWAKPVPVNPLNFHDRRKGILVSTAAGPISNLIQAVLFALALRLILAYVGPAGSSGNPQVRQFVILLSELCFVGVLINTGLAVFNLIPLYPLDGFHVLMQTLPARFQQRFADTAVYGRVVILILVFAGPVLKVDVLGMLILPPVRFVLRHVAGLT
ncbi:MAG TPA: site-2 protease family protein [Phycisphaerae bacterium]|nr:site-2 protease family protein [Phycisphaerae bacterium]